MRTSHVEKRSRKYLARQFVAETHDHKPDAPPREEKEPKIPIPQELKDENSV